MSQLLPLILVWLFANKNNGQGALTRSGPPPWPTPTSPPPMPAFNAQPSPHTADPSGSSTPLAALHNAPPKIAPASSTEPSHLSTPQAVKKAAIAAFKKKSTSLLKQRISKQTARVSTPSLSALLRNQGSGSATTVSVANVQKILNQRGAKLKQDGLYGPKTASAWSKIAKSKGLPDKIARASGTTAKVMTQTYDALSVPPIP